MASKNAFRTILSTIISAPTSISREQIRENADYTLTSTTIDEAINELIAEGFVKEHREAPGTYFTRTPRREEINNFISGATDDLARVIFTPDVQAEPTGREGCSGYYVTDSGQRFPIITSASSRAYDIYAGILRCISNSPEAIKRRDINYAIYLDIALPNLVNAGLIKEHREKADHFFTRKPMRELIQRFLNSPDMSVSELFNEATKVGAAATPTPTPTPTPNTAHTPERLPVGTIVTMSEVGMRAYTDRRNNPHGTRGVVSQNDRDSGFDTEFAYNVKWDNGAENNYRIDEIAPVIIAPANIVEPTPEAPAIDPRTDDFKTILNDICSAPGAIIAGDIHINMDDDEWEKAMTVLKNAGIVKEHADKPDHFFTRKPARTAIARFLAGEITLEQLLDWENLDAAESDTASEGRPEAVTSDIPDSAYTKVLSYIKTATEAVSLGDIARKVWPGQGFEAAMRVIKILTEAELIKEHRDKPGFYFTRKPMRDKIDAYLNGELGFGCLIDTDCSGTVCAAANSAFLDGAMMFDDFASCDATNRCETCDIGEDSDVEELLNLLETQRNMTNIILSKYGR